MARTTVKIDGLKELDAALKEFDRLAARRIGRRVLKEAGEPDWRPLFTVWGNIAFMRGGESVIAARLTARQPAILTIRNSAAARTIKPSDRAVNASTGEIFNIREQPRASKDSRGFLEMLIEAGASE